MKQPFENRPRFPGWPLVCVRENLLAFEDAASALKWHAQHCPRISMAEPRECRACGKYHVKTKKWAK